MTSFPQVMFALKNSRETIRAESSNIDPNAFCMNQWHSVKATLLNDLVQLIVDNQEDVLVQGKPGTTLTPTNSPLLIGGFPRKFVFRLGVRHIQDNHRCSA